MKKKENLMMLINRTSRVFKNMMREVSEQNGIIDTYRPIIIILSKEDGITQLELSKRLNLSKPTITLTLQKMETIGLIKRSKGEIDKRETRIFLTDLGKEYDQKILALVIKQEEKIFNGISKNDQEMAFGIVRRMLQNMLEIGGDNLENI